MCPLASHSRLAAHCATALLAGLLLAGCAAAGNQDSSPTPGLLDKLLGATAPAPEPVAPPPSPEKESCGTPGQCKSALKKLVESPKRGWVGQQQSPAAYIDGTRLFAYRALRAKLSCRELNLALTETRTVSKSLAGEVPGASADQISRTRALNSQVEGELARERGVRCKG
jgi:hypothetical protein